MTKTMKLKGLLMTNDGGKTWMVIHQWYLADTVTNGFLDQSLVGAIMTMKKEKENESAQPSEVKTQ